MSVDQFFSAMWKEKLAAQERRDALVRRKLSWITGLLAVGSLEISCDFKTALLLYLVPPIAIVFDLYIIGENYGIKRMGVFVGIQHKSRADAKWELWLKSRRDPFSRFALPLSTLIISVGAGAVLFSQYGHVVQLCIWSAVSLTFIIAVHGYAARHLNKLDDLLPGLPKNSADEK